MVNRDKKLLYWASYSVIVLGSLGLPVLHLLDIDVPDIIVLLVGLCELLAAPILVWSSMRLWLGKKK